MSTIRGIVFDLESDAIATRDASDRVHNLPDGQGTLHWSTTRRHPTIAAQWIYVPYDDDEARIDELRAQAPETVIGEPQDIELPPPPPRR